MCVVTRIERAVKQFADRLVRMLVFVVHSEVISAASHAQLRTCCVNAASERLPIVVLSV